MKSTLERTVEFGDTGFQNLHSVKCDEDGLDLSRWIDDDRSISAMSLSWEEWDAVVAEVERYRKLQAQSEAA